ncbi:MAG: hypothetical protein GY754_22975, partial [bacterium]|nr:hypothetical protein [bacterium]
MKKRSISVIFSLFACLFLLISTGCSSSNSFSGSDQTGILNLEIVMNNNSRMILPDIDMTPVSYVINGAGPDGAAFTMNTTDTLVDVMELAFGTWVIAVDGYNGEGTRIAYGTETVEVHTGETTPIDIIVSPLTGNGTLNVLLTWESEDTEIPSIESQLIASDGTTLDLDFEINANGDEGTYTNDALPAGYYTLSVKLLDNGIYTMGGVEIVRIVEGAETNGTIYFPEINKPGGNIGFAITANMGNPIDVTLSEIPGTIDPDATVEVTASVPDGTGDVFHTWYLNGNYAGMGSTANPTYTINAAELKLGNIYRLDVSTFSADGNRAGSASAKFKIEESALTWKYYHVFNQETGTPEIGHAKINDMPGTRALAIYDFLSETQTGDAIVLNAEGAVYSGDGTGAIYVSDCPVDSKSELVFTLDSRNDDTEAGIHSRAKDYSGATIDEIHGNGFMNVSVYYDDSSDTIIVNNNGYKHNLGSASGWTGSEFKIIVKQYGRLVQVDLYRAGIMQYQSNAILPEVLVSNVTEQFIVPYARKNITLNRFAFMDQVEAPFDPDNPIVDTTEPVGTPYTEPTNLWLYSHLFNKVEGEALDPSGAETNVENRFSIQSLSGNVIMGSYGLTIQGTDDFDIVMGSESPSNIHAESILKFTESGQHLLLLRGNNIEEIMSGGEDSSCLIVGMMLDNDEIILSVQEYMNGSIDGGVYGDNLCVNGCDLSDWIDQECRLVVDVFNKKVQAKLYKNDVLAGQLKFSLSDSSSSTGTQSGFLLDKNAPVKQYRFFEQTEEPFSGSGIDPINYG